MDTGLMVLASVPEMRSIGGPSSSVLVVPPDRRGQQVPAAQSPAGQRQHLDKSCLTLLTFRVNRCWFWGHRASSARGLSPRCRPARLTAQSPRRAERDWYWMRRIQSRCGAALADMAFRRQLHCRQAEDHGAVARKRCAMRPASHHRAGSFISAAWRCTASATGTVREDHAPVAPVSGYGQAKIECERIVRKYVDDGGDAVILRPTCVFGPGSPQWTNRLVRLLRARRIGDLGVAGDGICNLAFIDDLVAAIIAAMDAPGLSGPGVQHLQRMRSDLERIPGGALARRLAPRRFVAFRPARLRIETKCWRRCAGSRAWRSACACNRGDHAVACRAVAPGYPDRLHGGSDALAPARRLTGSGMIAAVVRHEAPRTEAASS